jgi:hypothetical protein
MVNNSTHINKVKNLLSPPPIIVTYIYIYILVVHRSSETSTNQSDLIVQSDDQFLNLVVDSDY